MRKLIRAIFCSHEWAPLNFGYMLTCRRCGSVQDGWRVTAQPEPSAPGAAPEHPHAPVRVKEDADKSG